MRRVELVAIEQEPENDGRGRKGHHVAEQQAPAERIAARRRDGDDQGDRAPHLDRARDPDELAEPAKVAERELETHGEEKEDDAEVGEDLHDFHVGEEAEPERPEQRSRQTETR